MISQSEENELLSIAREFAAWFAQSLPTEIDLLVRPKLMLHHKAVSLREALLHRSSALAAPAVNMFEQGNTLAGIVLTRHLAETAATMFALRDALARCIKTRNVEKFATTLHCLLFGTRWADATTKAENILNYIDLVNKEVPGFRASYETMSEFAHPNWSGTFGSFGAIDKLNRRLELGATSRAKGLSSGLIALAGSLSLIERNYTEMPTLLISLVGLLDSQAS